MTGDRIIISFSHESAALTPIREFSEMTQPEDPTVCVYHPSKFFEQDDGALRLVYMFDESTPEHNRPPHARDDDLREIDMVRPDSYDYYRRLTDKL